MTEESPMSVTSEACTTVTDLRSELAVAIDAACVHNEWTQTVAAHHLSMSQPTLSHMRTAARTRSLFPTHTHDTHRASTPIMVAALSMLGGAITALVAPAVGSDNHRPRHVTLSGDATEAHARTLALISEWALPLTNADIADAAGVKPYVVANVRAGRAKRVSMDSALALALAAGAFHSLRVIWPPGVTPYLPSVPTLRVVDVREGAGEAYTHFFLEETHPKRRATYRVVVDGDDVVMRTRTRMRGEHIVDPRSARARDLDTAVRWWKKYDN